MEVEEITDIDDSLYSRQRYVLGDHAMHKMAHSHVLIIGFGGLGVEIAKNVILAGTKSCTVQDDKVCMMSDLSTNYFITEADVQAKRSRIEAGVSKLAELNPHVEVTGIAAPARHDGSWSYLLKYTCVVCTEMDFETQVEMDEFCRSQDPPISFISGDIIGLFGYGFCDFGDSFTVYEKNGEEAREVFICNITNDNPAVVTVFDDRPHGFESGDRVVFRELKGLEALNGQQRELTVLTPYQFTITDVAQYGQKYTGGGIATECKIPHSVKFKSLRDELPYPSLTVADFAKFEAPGLMHVMIQTHYRLQSRVSVSFEEFANEVNKLNKAMSSPVQVDETTLRLFFMSRNGCFPPLCAVFGGFLAQEVLKAVSGKFTPLNQWFHLDTIEVVDASSIDRLNTSPRNDRYDLLRHCVGEQVCQELHNVNLFMVGCGAIGCEMMKLYAQLGLCTTGKITVTDNDLIEKSNLNRQFLFRPQHVQKSKSRTAAESALQMNPALNIEAQELKVSPATESTTHTDEFLKQQTVIVNALDNVEARMYMDQRCVTVGRPLLESGTTGAKGHTQIVVPHLTESYSSQTDPIDEDVPFCSLKSFPAKLDHCIIWARNKFNSSFTDKPQVFNKFMNEVKTPETFLQGVLAGSAITRDAWITVRQLRTRPTTLTECVQLARLKFEKYFNHKAKALLHAYPLDHKRDDGNDFWLLPRRPPTALQFSCHNSIHMDFVRSTARLFGETFGVDFRYEDLSYEFITSSLDALTIPEFVPSNKRILVEAGDKSNDPNAQPGNLNETEVVKLIQRRLQHSSAQRYFSTTEPIEFEKDDDSNGHIDYIVSTANLRAEMYGIAPSDRFTIKRIAGKIIPAIATTTATVAGLVIIELFKILRKAPLEAYKNCFLSLALPYIVLSEPGAAVRTEVCEGLSFTLWDRLEVRGNSELTVQEFMAKAKELLPLDADMIVQGSRIIFSSMMPTHRKRVSHRLNELLAKPANKNYVDLIVCFTGLSPDVALKVPPIRYYL